MLASPRSHLYFFELVQRAACAHSPMESRQDFWRNELLYRPGEIERHLGAKRALLSRGRDVHMQDVLPTCAQHDDVAVSEFEK